MKNVRSSQPYISKKFVLKLISSFQFFFISSQRSDNEAASLPEVTCHF